MLQRTPLNIIDTGNRTFVFGGSYGNLQATQAILAQADKLGFQPNQIIFTGDTVAYCGQPAETVDLIRTSGIHAIQGNCEEALGEDADNCGCGFEEGSTCNALSAEWYRFCQNSLGAEAKGWMQSLPLSLTVKVGNSQLLCLHGTPNAINEFVFPSDIKNGNLHYGSDASIDGYIVGHSGIPFIANINGTAWINSGAAGMPANDGTHRVWYATIEHVDNMLVAETHSIEYDHKAASDAMTHAGLENGYRDCLFTGIWPSQDVLPEAERLLTGVPLKAQKHVFETAHREKLFESEYRTTSMLTVLSPK